MKSPIKTRTQRRHKLFQVLPDINDDFLKELSSEIQNRIRFVSHEVTENGLGLILDDVTDQGLSSNVMIVGRTNEALSNDIKT